jgi:integral membrane sensor domain MASE1
LFIAFGLYFGIFNALSITLAFFLEPWFGTNSTAVAVVGGAPIISGILGVIVIAPFQKRSKVFKKWIIICMLGSVSAMILFYPLL